MPAIGKDMFQRFLLYRVLFCVIIMAVGRRADVRKTKEGIEMLAIERKNMILSELREKKRVVVGELAAKFGVSEETIRHDLMKLEHERGVVKTYGGAILNIGVQSEVPFMERRGVNAAANARIALLAARMVRDGDSVFLDASSASVFIAHALKNKKALTVLTNSVDVLIELSDVSGWRILCTGGMLKGSGVLVGSRTEEILGAYRGDIAFVSCRGICRDGFFESDEYQASVKRKMLANSMRKVVAAESGRLGKRAFAGICALSGADALLLETRPPEPWGEVFSAAGTKLFYPEENRTN